MAQEWVEISKDATVYPGDRLRFRYTVIGPRYLVAAETLLIERRLESDPKFVLLGTDLPKDGGWVSSMGVRVQVRAVGESGVTPQMQQAGIDIGYIVAAITAAAAGLFILFSLRGCEKLVDVVGEKTVEMIDTVGGKSKEIAVGSLGMAAAIVAVLLAWKYAKGKK